MSDNKLEPRVEVDLTVRVWGMGADSRPFFQNAHAQNISGHGAKLTGIEHALKPGDVIGVQVGDKKARCKVVWVIDAGQLQKIQAGVQMVEGQPCPWQQQIAHAEQPATAPATTAAPAQPSPVSQPGRQNKRRYERHKVPFPLEIRNEASGGTHMRTQATDIGGRGCYVETMIPLAAGTALSITFWLDSEKVVTPAVVRTCDGGVGMGIEFTGLDDATQQRLQQRIKAMEQDSGSAKNAQGAT